MSQKRLDMMIYTAILFLIGTSIIGGNNNTVFPMFSEIRGWDVNVINVVSGLAVSQRQSVYWFWQEL